MSDETVQITVSNLDPEVVQFFRQQAEDEDRSLSAVVRRVLVEKVQAHKAAKGGAKPERQAA